MSRERIDIAIVGAGAAGLMSAIFAGREAQEAGRPLTIVAFDGGKRIGVKILVAGGGRCNVTHHEVTHDQYAGGKPNAIKSVLRRFDVQETVAFFKDLGVHLKREDTGKLFPTTDNAHTVLDALLRAADDAGAEIRHPARIESIEKTPDGFTLGGDLGEIDARRVIMACGGKALPRSGSDGGGYKLAQTLGHTITDRVFPALVPLILEKSCVLREISGVAVPALLELRGGTGKRLKTFTNSTLCTHFGLSGPAPMDISRYYTAAHLDDRGAHLVACWLPEADRDALDHDLQQLGKRSVAKWLRDKLPESLAHALLEHARVPRDTTGSDLTRDARRALLAAIFEMPLPITGDRGFTHAETTAGGVPLDEVTVKTMSSRVCEGLHLCGEICDVDGRIGGFNFQWAWSSGWIAGRAAAAALASDHARAAPRE
ncbi:MAG: NAD(P)/FAD-dependent oxidoreductase [Planctomycetota bacterium]